MKLHPLALSIVYTLVSYSRRSLSDELLAISALISFVACKLRRRCRQEMEPTAVNSSD